MHVVLITSDEQVFKDTTIVAWCAEMRSPAGVVRASALYSHFH